MKVYTYCSYRFSPVGFILGTFEADPENSSDGYVVPEVDTDKDSVVRKCFEDGLIQKVFGNIPETEEYFILLKKIECDYKNEDGMSIPKYGNFAFSTTDPKEYLNMLYNLDKMPPSELAAAMNAFLIPDSKAENVAIRIDMEPFSEFLRRITRQTPSENDKAPDYLTIDAISSSDKVTNTLRERFSDFDVSPGSNNRYFIKKKQQNFPIVLAQQVKQHPAAAVTATAVPLFTVILLLILKFLGIW